MVVTFLASYLIWLLLLGLLVLWLVDGRIKREVALHALLAYFVSWVVAYILKIIFHTPRPYLVTQIPPLTATIPHDFAFPSGHAAMAFGLAVTVWLHNKKIGTGFLLIAITIGIARVWAHVHWPIDIIGGAGVGTTVALAIDKFHLFSLITRKK